MSEEADNKREDDRIEVDALIHGLRVEGREVIDEEAGRTVINMPLEPYMDCRGCRLNFLVCEDELEYPCKAMRESCLLDEKPNGDFDCEECDKLIECLDKRVCCWLCEHLIECLEMNEDWGSEYVEDRFECDWETFKAAVKILQKVYIVNCKR